MKNRESLTNKVPVTSYSAREHAPHINQAILEFFFFKVTQTMKIRVLFIINVNKININSI